MLVKSKMSAGCGSFKKEALCQSSRLPSERRSNLTCACVCMHVCMSMRSIYFPVSHICANRFGLEDGTTLRADLTVRWTAYLTGANCERKNSWIPGEVKQSLATTNPQVIADKACEQWSKSDTWGALRQNRTLAAACAPTAVGGNGHKGWGLRNCGRTCCEAVHDASKKVKLPEKRLKVQLLVEGLPSLSKSELLFDGSATWRQHAPRVTQGSRALVTIKAVDRDQLKIQRADRTLKVEISRALQHSQLLVLSYSPSQHGYSGLLPDLLPGEYQVCIELHKHRAVNICGLQLYITKAFAFDVAPFTSVLEKMPTKEHPLIILVSPDDTKSPVCCMRTLMHTVAHLLMQVKLIAGGSAGFIFVLLISGMLFFFVCML